VSGGRCKTVRVVTMSTGSRLLQMDRMSLRSRLWTAEILSARTSSWVSGETWSKELDGPSAEARAVAGIAQHLRDVTPDTSWNRVCKSRAFDGCGTESHSACRELLAPQAIKAFLQPSAFAAPAEATRQTPMLRASFCRTCATAGRFADARIAITENDAGDVPNAVAARPRDKRRPRHPLGQRGLYENPRVANQ